MAVSEQIRLRNNKLAQYYGYFTIGFILLALVIGGLEVMAGMPQPVIGWIFLMLTMGMYAFIGILSRTKALDEYYVAGRNVPAVFNGMATGADWMSAASFISMAGTLYALGYDGLAYIMGWTGGYVLLALLFAPYIRKFGQYTIPDFVGARYGGKWARGVAAISAIIVSLTYVTAQVVGVGLIMSRFVGVSYEWGVIIGLSGVLFCSFLGGMKAVTWTQVAQYIILIIAYLIPVTFLSIKLTGFPIPQLAYGQALQGITAKERELNIAAESKARDGTDRIIVGGYVPAYNEGISNAAAVAAVAQINRTFGWNVTPPAAASIPNTAKPAEEVQPDWRGTPWNFLALTFCLMVGTAGLPHILIRFYTVPSVRESRMSVGFALFFIFLLYFTAPAYAAFARWNILENVVGQQISNLPSWTANWGKQGLITLRDYSTLEGADPAKLPTWAAPAFTGATPTITHTDLNGDGKINVAPFVAADANDAAKGGTAGELSGTALRAGNTDGTLQFAELVIDSDLIVLATPEIAGLPYTVAALVAAGGLAAALSTADGLLVVISSAIAHDFYFRIVNPKASLNTRIWLGKIMLVVAAAVAAMLALPRLALIAQMVAWAFSMAASSFFPVVLLGIFWKRCNGPGVIAGMIGGLITCIAYLAINYVNPSFNVLGITHLAAGIFGMPVNFALCYIVSMLTPAPSKETMHLVDTLRHPMDEDDVVTEALADLERRPSLA